MNDNSLRIVFMGTPLFAVPVLGSLLEAGHEIVGAYTQPDRKAGRGKKLQPSAVKQFALENDLPLYQPASLRRDQSARDEFNSLSADLIVVAAYGLFLPVEVFDSPRLKTLNIHPSLLPKYRGASPVSSAILNGDEVTGVTVMLIDEGMDSGDIVAQVETPIEPHETSDVLTLRLFEMGAKLLVETIPKWQRGEIKAYPQNDSKAIITERLSREDGRIDWSKSAEHIVRQIRAYHPWPGTFTYHNDKPLKVIRGVLAAMDDESYEDALVGTVVQLSDESIGVVTADGIVALEIVQAEGRRAVSVSEFAHGYPNFIGSRLD